MSMDFGPIICMAALALGLLCIATFGIREDKLPTRWWEWLDWVFGLGG